jgi:hypothetical protein
VNTSSSPELAILLVADSKQLIRKTLRYYRAQTDPARLELVVALLDGTDTSADWLRAEGFVNVRIVDAGGGNLARAEMLAVQTATAPFVVFAQAHAYSQPGFVDAILAASKSGPWSVIGPTMENANPGSAVSRAAMQINYGPWYGNVSRGARPAGVPGHNAAYRRTALLALGEGIEKALPAGDQLQKELTARGHELFYEPAACIRIVNVSRLRWFLEDLCRQGVLFASERREHWSLARRLAYAAGAPLIPAVRLARILSQVVTTDRFGTLWTQLPAMLCGLIANAAGEFVGYVFGKNAWADSCETSFHRLSYVRNEDRRADADEGTWPPAN